jgi:hypothetical protein
VGRVKFLVVVKLDGLRIVQFPTLLASASAMYPAVVPTNGEDEKNPVAETCPEKPVAPATLIPVGKTTGK